MSIVDSIEITTNSKQVIPIEELKKYAEYVKEKNPGKQILSINVDFDEEGENVDLSYQTKSVNFERIRRITGYQHKVDA